MSEQNLIGQIIHQKRTALGLTLEQVGDAVGVSKSTVKKWESGFISNMGRDKIAALAECLDLNPVTLVTGELNPIPNILDARQEQLLTIFHLLNNLGKDKLLSYGDDLTTIPKYTETTDNKKKQA